MAAVAAAVVVVGKEDPFFVLFFLFFFYSVVGSFHHSIIQNLFFPSLIHLGYCSSPRRYAYLRQAVPVQFPPQIGAGGD